jgi:hypothetical protein
VSLSFVANQVSPWNRSIGKTNTTMASMAIPAITKPIQSPHPNGDPYLTDHPAHNTGGNDHHASTPLQSLPALPRPPEERRSYRQIHPVKPVVDPSANLACRRNGEARPADRRSNASETWPWSARGRP